MGAQVDLLDPLQGYDIKVQVFQSGDTVGSAPLLAGAFTSLMFKIVNQTETYLPLNSRIPRMLDGEIIIVWSLEQGLVDLDVIGKTFGGGFATGLASARGFGVIPRSQRFSILFETNLAAGDITGMAANDTGFYQDSKYVTNGTQYALQFCRVDTCNFGVAAGRHLAANTWQGTAQQIGKPNAANGGGLPNGTKNTGT